ncbi:hypothetical protein ACJX0J_033681, partial [Zea mays]
YIFATTIESLQDGFDWLVVIAGVSTFILSLSKVATFVMFDALDVLVVFIACIGNGENVQWHGGANLLFVSIFCAIPLTWVPRLDRHSMLAHEHNSLYMKQTPSASKSTHE